MRTNSKQFRNAWATVNHDVARQKDKRIRELETTLQLCMRVMQKHISISPETEAAFDHPWVVLRRAKAALGINMEGVE